MTEIRFSVTVSITNEASLRSFAGEVDYPEAASGPLADAIHGAVFNPEKAPLDSGFEIMAGSRVIPTDAETVFLVNLVLNVSDPDALVAEARRRYQECWQDEDWQPGTLAEAAFEVLVGSNASPSPDLVGFEIRDTAYVIDQPVGSPDLAPAPGR